jgi:hypothetical protein
MLHRLFAAKNYFSWWVEAASSREYRSKMLLPQLQIEKNTYRIKI